MGLNPKVKGAKGELEFIGRYQPFFPNTTLKRNLLQTREGGADITGGEPWVIEVKRCQQIENNKWWKQVKAAINDPTSEIPVVAFRQNHGQWRFQVPSDLMGIEDDSYVICSEDIWLKLVFRFGTNNE